MRSQVDRITTALNQQDIPVIGVLCFLEADWPLIGGSFTVSGVHVTWPRQLIKRMTDAPTHSVDVAAVHARLADAFPIS